MHDVLPDIWRAKLARPWPSYASPLDVRMLVFRKDEMAAYGGRRILADPDPVTDPLGLQEGVHASVLRAQVKISSSNPANSINFITMSSRLPPHRGCHCRVRSIANVEEPLFWRKYA